jgi:stage V sporulation protein B
VAVRLGLIAVLVPRAGMPGFLWMMLADNVVTALLHANRVLEVMEMRMDWARWVLLPLVCAAAVYGGGAWLRVHLLTAGWNGLWTALAVGGCMAASYLALLVLLRCFTPQELQAVFARGKNRANTGILRK